MAKFLIEWGFRDEILIKDVVEAVDIDAAIREADRMAEDLWESNKTVTAKPFTTEKTDTTKCTGTPQILSPPSS